MLRNALIAEAICHVDRSDSYYIRNPYSNTPTASVHTIDGSYAVTAYTTTNDALTISDEVTYGEHIYDFENVLNNYDLWADRVDTLSYSVAAAIDKWVDIIAHYKLFLIIGKALQRVTRGKLEQIIALLQPQRLSGGAMQIA